MARMRTGEFDPPTMNPYNQLNLSVVDRFVCSPSHFSLPSPPRFQLPPSLFPDLLYFFSPAHRALAVEAATQSFVLLKNDGVLPLKVANYKSIAILGPQANATTTIFGDYSPNPPYIITAYEGIKEYATSYKIATTFTPGIPKRGRTRN